MTHTKTRRPKIFIYRKGALGDTLSFIPFVYALKERYEKIIFAGNYLYRDIFKGIDFVEYLDADSTEVFKLLTGKEKVISNRVEQSLIFTSSSLNDKSSPMHFPPLPENGWFYEHPFKSLNAECIPKPIYLPVFFFDKLLSVLSGNKYFVFHPGSGGKDKVWPVENFIYLENVLNRLGFEVVYLLGEAEGDCYRSALKGRHVFCNYTFNEIIFLLSYTTGFLGCDSGISHLAGLLNVRGWAIFGPSSPERFRPWGNIQPLKMGNYVTDVKREYMAELIGRYIEKRRHIYNL